MSQFPIGRLTERRAKSQRQQSARCHDGHRGAGIPQSVQWDRSLVGEAPRLGWNVHGVLEPVRSFYDRQSHVPLRHASRKVASRAPAFNDLYSTKVAGA